MKLEIMRELLAIAGSLDEKGFAKEADIIDRIVKSAAAGDGSTARRYDRLMEMQERTGPGEIDDGSGYTYDYLGNEDAFIVRTTPPQNWSATGYKMPKGHAGYTKLQSQGFGPQEEEGDQVVFDDSTITTGEDLEARVLYAINGLDPEKDFRGNEYLKEYKKRFIERHPTVQPEAMNQLLTNSFRLVRSSLLSLMQGGLPFEESRLRSILKATVPSRDQSWVELIVFSLNQINAIEGAAEARPSARVDVPMAGLPVPAQPD